MSKKPKIDHDYHAGKDRLEISIRGYALKRKKDREAVLKGVIHAVERSPAFLISKEKKHESKKSKKRGKHIPGSRREVQQFDEEDDD